MPSVNMKPGWDGPVKIDWRFYLAEISSALKAGYDESGIGQQSGALRNSLGLSHLSVQKGKDGFPRAVVISDMPAYARVQDVGGWTGSKEDPQHHYARSKRFMHFFAYGQEWFLRKANAAYLPGFQYIKAGIDKIGERLNLIFVPGWRKR